MLEEDTRSTRSILIRAPTWAFASASICGTAPRPVALYSFLLVSQHLALTLVCLLAPTSACIYRDTMDGFGDDEIESILYIGREVSGICDLHVIGLLT